MPARSSCAPAVLLDCSTGGVIKYPGFTVTIWVSDRRRPEHLHRDARLRAADRRPVLQGTAGSGPLARSADPARAGTPTPSCRPCCVSEVGAMSPRVVRS
ncbi:hypothetical protein HBB16_19085 [Pseudonocardia sp. MCCB 268]|nr:hypothetical protein [Pseudonocardia cytotoxica]